MTQTSNYDEAIAAIGSPGLDNLFAKFDEQVIESKPLSGLELQAMAEQES